MQENINIKEIQAIIESILFACGEAVYLDKISLAIGLDKSTTKSILTDMIYRYKESDRGVLIRELGNKYQLCSKPIYHDYIKKVVDPIQRQGLSKAAFETLAIIAYNQPVTKASVEQVRGVSCETSIMRLMERNLIREAGRMDSPGRPILYETTDEFLRCFGLRTHKDIPGFGISEIKAEKTNDELLN